MTTFTVRSRGLLADDDIDVRTLGLEILLNGSHLLHCAISVRADESASFYGGEANSIQSLWQTVGAIATEQIFDTIRSDIETGDVWIPDRFNVDPQRIRAVRYNSRPMEDPTLPGVVLGSEEL